MKINNMNEGQLRQLYRGQLDWEDNLTEESRDKDRKASNVLEEGDFIIGYLASDSAIVGKFLGMNEDSIQFEFWAPVLDYTVSQCTGFMAGKSYRGSRSIDKLLFTEDICMFKYEDNDGGFEGPFTVEQFETGQFVFISPNKVVYDIDFDNPQCIEIIGTKHTHEICREEDRWSVCIKNIQ